jgi:hypothetical protein
MPDLLGGRFDLRLIENVHAQELGRLLQSERPGIWGCA